MGKIRVKTFGDEELEKKESKKAQARAEAKKQAEAAKKAAEERTTAAEPKKASSDVIASEAKQSSEGEIAASPSAPRNDEVKKQKKEKFQTKKRARHSNAYAAVATHVDRNKKYPLSEALALLPKLKRAKFDETVELHINTNDKGISGHVTLPHGTGKQIRVAIANAADVKELDSLVAKIEGGAIDFDVLIATPDSMPKLARVARILGPRGLMPNPKNGTVSPKPEEVAKKFQGGQMNFKTEAKFPLLHMAIGKLSFGEKKLEDNVKTAINAIQMKNVKKVTLKSTMSPGIKLDTASL